MSLGGWEGDVCVCLSSKSRGKVTIQKGCALERRRRLIRPQTRRSSAWCCPAGSVARSCICLGRRAHSRCGGDRSGCSWTRHGPEPALRSGSNERRKKCEKNMEQTALNKHPLLYVQWINIKSHHIVMFFLECCPKKKSLVTLVQHAWSTDL